MVNNLLLLMFSDSANAVYMVHLFRFCLAGLGINAPWTRDDVKSNIPGWLPELKLQLVLYVRAVYAAISKPSLKIGTFC